MGLPAAVLFGLDTRTLTTPNLDRSRLPLAALCFPTDSLRTAFALRFRGF